MTDYNKYKKLDQKRSNKRKKAILKRVYNQVTDAITINFARMKFYDQWNAIERICHKRVWGL